MFLMNLLLIFICLFQSDTLTINVLDEASKKLIPYVSYVRLSDRKGSFANQDGSIAFTGNLDTPYVLSCVGYQTDTIVPSKVHGMILLKPLTIELPEVKITTNKTKRKIINIGYLGKFSWMPWHAAIPRKMAISTFIPSEDKAKKWEIIDIKMDIGANKSEIYSEFLIRLFIKENNNQTPGKDLLIKDMIVSVKANSYKYTFPLQESIELPSNGCFVGFETIGKIDKKGNFIPFSDFYEKPLKPFEFTFRLVKCNSYSMEKFGGFDWLRYRKAGNNPDTYAIGLNISEISK